MPTAAKSQARRWLLHAYRVGLFVFLIVMIHRQHAWFVEQKRGEKKQLVSPEQVRPFYPSVATLSDWDPGHGGQNVFDESGTSLGYVIQTSPEADRVVGFSGPTNTLLAFGKNNRVLGILILSSDDTREHLSVVLKDEEFLTAWNGLSRAEAGEYQSIDAVSGSTLTSMAIANGITTRLGGTAATSRFPDEIILGEVRLFLPEAATLMPLPDRPSLLEVLDPSSTRIGSPRFRKNRWKR